jgi:hypothetical protein
MNPAYNKILSLLSENDTRPGNPIPSQNMFSAYLRQQAMNKKIEQDEKDKIKQTQERRRQRRQPLHKKVARVLTNPPLGRKPEGEPDSNIQHYIDAYAATGPKNRLMTQPPHRPDQTDTYKNKAPRRGPTRRGRRT